MPLTDKACKSAKPDNKPYRLADGGGMYLEVMPNGGRYWRLKYRLQGKEKRLAIGVYPQVSLADARQERDKAKKLLAEGKDPSEAKQEKKLAHKYGSENSFEAIAREWHDHQKGAWTKRYAETVLNRMERDVFPKIGHKPITEIPSRELLDLLRSIEGRGAIDLAHRAMQVAGQVFRYAIVTGRGERDPSADLKGALKTVKKQHHNFLREDELPEFMHKLETYDGHHLTKYAMRLLLLTFVRTVEIRGARWEEINFDKAVWRIPAERMKMREEHIVPLARQTVELLREIQQHSGNREHVFPNQQHPQKMMSENTMLYAMYRMGYHGRATAHGFRSTASTILNEHGFRPDVIERQLAHAERNKIRASYNHAEYLTERKEMMQWWADYVERISGS